MTKPTSSELIGAAKEKSDGRSVDVPRVVTITRADGGNDTRQFATEAVMIQFMATRLDVQEVTSVR